MTRSCSSTYFCVVGWGPAGYSGIQEVGEDRRVAIFSMWNTGCGDHRVELLRAGEGTVVDNFGGEGTGLKTMKDLDWQLGEKTTFVVSTAIFQYSMSIHFQARCHLSTLVKIINLSEDPVIGRPTTNLQHYLP